MHRLRSLPVLAFVALCLWLTAVPTAGAQSSLTSAPGEAATLASLVNSYRAQNGLSQLAFDGALAGGSQGHANALMGGAPPVAGGCPRGVLSHASVSAIFASAPGNAAAVGENLAYHCDVNSASHAHAMFNGLRASPSHNATMLDARWTHMGSAAAKWGGSTVGVTRFAQVPGAAQNALPEPAPVAASIPEPAPVAVASVPEPEPVAVAPAPEPAPAPATLSQTQAASASDAGGVPADVPAFDQNIPETLAFTGAATWLLTGIGVSLIALGWALTAADRRSRPLFSPF